MMMLTGLRSAGEETTPLRLSAFTKTFLRYCTSITDILHSILYLISLLRD